MLESSELVEVYSKNDHLNFHIHYLWNGSRRRFVPDFLIRLANVKTLVLEIKGQDTPQDKAKRSALKAWTQAVNAWGGFGLWCDDVAFEMAQIQDILARYMAASAIVQGSAA